MNIALLGSGGREHSLCQKIYDSKLSKNRPTSLRDLLYGSMFNSFIIFSTITPLAFFRFYYLMSKVFP